MPLVERFEARGDIIDAKDDDDLRVLTSIDAPVKMSELTCSS